MNDPRIETLARNLINYSCAVKPGERVLIHSIGVQPMLVNALIRETYKAEGQPFVWLNEPSVQRELLMNATDDQFTKMAELDAAVMSSMQAYIGIRSGDNGYEMADVSDERMSAYSRLYGKPVHSLIRVPQTKWVVLRYPAPSMAQQAEMSTAAFEDFYFNVCNLDYAKMSRAMDALVKRMENTDKVRLIGPGTDLSFSIKGLPAIKCDGKLNIPDGEVFTAPVRGSVNGTLRYNTSSLYQGTSFDNISFRFENGRIVEASSSETLRMNAILDTDEGARFVGEFAIGVNPYINKAMNDTLFDEKIAGSFHFTPGNAYDDCDNGNKSAIHWDLVCIQTAEKGGGEIYFDGQLVRKGGLFVTDDLKCLNPEALI
ncbi:MAG: aminopeptidase [Oscillospiraceae bacterium]|jgi:aminopeptidase|nr:aminopeptidase [Oscillospiraceae bacterium]